jgi:hypothetical protein
MTNREWIESLSDEDLARFLMIGLRKEYESNTYPAYIGVYSESIADIARHYTQSTTGIMQWLNEVHKEN